MSTERPATHAEARAGGAAWQFPPRNVIVAVDFGEASARAAALAGALAKAFGARLGAVHAERFEPPPYFTLEQIARLEAERRQSESAAALHLARFMADATDWPVETHIADAPPVDAVLQAAATADLIVAGTHGRSGPGRWWLGSVAERIVRGTAVPILVTRAGTATAAADFERIALVGHDVEPASAGRRVAEGLAAAFGGRVLPAGSPARCEPEAMAGASLVVMEIDSGQPLWSTGSSVGRVLASCQRPVLFVPVAPNA